MVIWTYFIEYTWNKGFTWSEAIRVNDDPISNDVLQDLVWGDFDSDGDLILTWRDRRNAPVTGFATSSEIYGAILWKDALTFTPNFNISGPAAGFDSVLYENGNDFMCVNLEQDTVYATWGDTRSGYLNIWFNKFADGDAGNNSISCFTALWMADIHYGGGKPEDILPPMIAEIAPMNPRPAFICIVGDLICAASRAFGIVPGENDRRIAVEEFSTMKPHYEELARLAPV